MAGHYIPNTRIAVDIWEEVPEKKICFLTHFHGAQTVGLTSMWKNTVHTSELNARYLVNIIKVKPKYLKVLEVNKAYTICHNKSKERFSVAVICAYHCPGSVMFLFEGSFGKILYTGHCRYKPSMLKNPVLAETIASQNLDVVFLDNSYASPDCRFPSDVECLMQVVELIRANPGRKILLAMSEEDESQALHCLVKVLKGNICVSKETYSIAQKLLDGEAKNWFTNDPSQSLIHAVELSSVVTERKKDTSVVTILLTLEYQFGDKYLYFAQESDVYILPYSTHSSHCELASFLSQLHPRRIVPIIEETSSKRSVIPKQLHDLCRVPSADSSSLKTLKRPLSVGTVKTIESPLKSRRTRSPRKNLSLNNSRASNLRSRNGCDGDIGAIDFGLNVFQKCSQEGVVLKVESKDDRANESSESTVVSCSSSSCEIRSTSADKTCDQGYKKNAIRNLSVLSSLDPIPTPFVMPSDSIRLVKPVALNGARVNEEVRVFEDDALSMITVAPDMLEINDNYLSGTTLHQYIVESDDNSRLNKCKVDCGVQTDSVYQTNLLDRDHQCSDDEVTFLPSVHLLPTKLKKEMKLRLCECDVCMTYNKMKHSRMFSRQKCASIVEESESDELEPTTCSVFETVTKYKDKNIMGVSDNVRKNDNTSLVHTVKCCPMSEHGKSMNIFSKSSGIDIDPETRQFPVRISKCLAENMQEDFSLAAQKLKNNCWVTEYEATVSFCACNDESEEYRKLISGNCWDARSSMCDRINTEKGMTSECAQLNGSSKHSASEESMHINRNHDSESHEAGLRSPVQSCAGKSPANSFHKSNQDIGGISFLQNSFLEQLNLTSKKNTQSSEKPEQHGKSCDIYDEPVKSDRTSQLKKCALWFKKNDIMGKCSRISSQQKSKEQSLYRGMELMRINSNSDCAVTSCNKSLRVTLTRLKPEQINGFNYSVAQKSVMHDKLDSLIGEPISISESSKETWNLKGIDEVHERSEPRSSGESKLIPNFNQVQSDQHSNSEEENFVTASSKISQSMHCSNSTFFTAVNTSLPSTYAKITNFEKTTANHLSPKRKLISDSDTECASQDSEHHDIKNSREDGRERISVHKVTIKCKEIQNKKVNPVVKHTNAVVRSLYSESTTNPLVINSMRNDSSDESSTFDISTKSRERENKKMHQSVESLETPDGSASRTAQVKTKKFVGKKATRNDNSNESDTSKDSTKFKKAVKKLRQCASDMLSSSTVKVRSTVSVVTKSLRKDSSDDSSISEMIEKIGRTHKVRSQSYKSCNGSESVTGENYSQNKNKGKGKGYKNKVASGYSSLISRQHEKNSVADISAQKEHFTGDNLKSDNSECSSSSSSGDDCFIVYDGNQSDQHMSPNNIRSRLRSRTKCNNTNSNTNSKAKEMCTGTQKSSSSCSSVSSESNVSSNDFFLTSSSRCTRLRRQLVNSRHHTKNGQHQFYKLS